MATAAQPLSGAAEGKPHADSISSHDLEHDEERIHGYSIRAQLEGWHANRGSKSIARAIIPPWCPEKSEPTELNPLKFLKELTWLNWALFLCGWWAWTCDGFDYFAVSVTLTELGKVFGKSDSQMSFAITLTLLFRSLGALIFGVLADRFGRKWTLTANMLIIAALQLGSGFVTNYSQFLGVRSAFGIAMGGVWGQAAATSLENVPAASRGFFSGIVQQGYTIGYLLAAVINMTVGTYSAPKWRSLYFIGAGFSAAAAIFRMCLPESQQFLRAREEQKASGVSLSGKEAARQFFREVGHMLRSNWIRCIWAICIMTGMNFFSHGSQDLYPTYLTKTKGLNKHNESVAVIIANCGAIAGGLFGGYISQIIGRRWALILLCLWTAPWIPLWIIPDSFGGLAAGGFFVQSGVQGAWGVIPIYLSEVSPPAFRASFAGLAYQLGNMASAGAAQIEADAGHHLRTIVKGKELPDYATIFGILLGVIIAYLLITTLLGPDADASNFEEAKVATQAGAGNTVAAQRTGRRWDTPRRRASILKSVLR
ncbi:carboxylic acid transporter [Cutaneotrichosporon oleaginosum]|uniref:Carboxylic acid transporter n=1 Tax=Cutaneotrichosporon oleaginosum TaxID=879819 RepID=A0A0J0XP77_9TREE|nr:carboxylic acid transporter [Cutaneotrichosporon oleaginosum]KLT42908.1 carboxylic acid transporter [Cutaneotrichosporon oleaginosum]